VAKTAIFGLAADRGNKKGVVWHNDAGEKDETVFTGFIGSQGRKSPLFLPGHPAEKPR
jgi:hypothetical protein